MNKLVATAASHRALFKSTTKSSVPLLSVIAFKDSIQNQNRFIQTLRKKNNPGFFDVVSGIYENDKYKMDLKPFEFREGEPFFLFNYFGVVIITIPATMAFLLSFTFLIWYTLADSQVTRTRSNPHPFLEIKNGEDMTNTFVPFLKGSMKYGILNADYKMLFWNEINRAKNKTL